MIMGSLRYVVGISQTISDCLLFLAPHLKNCEPLTILTRGWYSLAKEVIFIFILNSSHTYCFMDEEVHLRLSILTDELSSDLSHALRVCQDLAVSTVELRMVGDTNIVFYDTASLLSMKTLLDREGFRVCTIASPFLKCAFWHEQQDQ